MQETKPSSEVPVILPFASVELSLKGLSFVSRPDPDVNILFEVNDSNSPENKYLLEFVDDGIRIYIGDNGANVSEIERGEMK